jgi:cell division protein FtsL
VKEVKSERETTSLLALLKPRTSNCQKKLFAKTGTILACVALLSMPCLVSCYCIAEKDKEIAVLNSGINQLEDYLDRNVSQIKDLNRQIQALNQQICEFGSLVDEKAAENEKLKLQVRDLSSAFSQVEAELDGLVKAEHIYLLADRLRNPD